VLSALLHLSAPHTAWLPQNAAAVEGPKDSVVDEAAEELTTRYGIPVIVAAGNQGRDACRVGSRVHIVCVCVYVCV